jgi:voltage-gated potassium channel Kch
LFLLNLLLAAAGTERRLRSRFLYLILVVAAIRVIGGVGDSFQLKEGSAFAFAALVLVAAVRAFRHALRAREADSEHLYAALSAYLLAGFFFGIVATTLDRVAPGSYVEGNSAGGSGLSTIDAIYFSFVTLATLGYGDIVPKSDLARGLAVVEAIAGQLYIAVLVARLVAVSVSKKSED